MKKIIIFGIKNDLDAFFAAAQEEGFVEFIGKEKEAQDFNLVIKDYLLAIKILKKQPLSDEKPAEKFLTAKDAISRVTSLSASIEHLTEEKRNIRNEIIRIAPFGRFSKKDLESIQQEAHRFLQFFCIKAVKRKNITPPEEMIYITTQYDLDYYVAVNREKKEYPDMIEIFIDKPLNILTERLSKVQRQIYLFQKELKALGSYLKPIRRALLQQLNSYNLGFAKKHVSYVLDDALFAVEAWAPQNKMENLKKLIIEYNVSFEEIALEKDERVPTYMENKGLSRMGEDLVYIYDTPAIDDKDPSTWVMVAFTLFFSMIVSDAGYGLVYLLVGILMKIYLKNLMPSMKRFINMVFILSIGCIVWGVVVGSFFGVGGGINSSLSRLAPINYLALKEADYHLANKDEEYQEYLKKFPKIASAKTGYEYLVLGERVEEKEKKYEIYENYKNDALMELSILIGMVHITISLLRYVKRNWPAVGWVLFIWGGYLYFPGFLKTASFANYLFHVPVVWATLIGREVLLLGIILAFVLALFQKKWMGIMEPLNIIQIFADIMSYLRIYALGLASTIMASTFNDMGVAAGMIFGFFIILAGHLLNITLSVMGGVIHGLRLNFIEWYHHSFKGDGKLFKPLKLLKL